MLTKHNRLRTTALEHHVLFGKLLLISFTNSHKNLNYVTSTSLSNYRWRISAPSGGFLQSRSSFFYLSTMNSGKQSSGNIRADGRKRKPVFHHAIENCTKKTSSTYLFFILSIYECIFLFA